MNDFFTGLFDYSHLHNQKLAGVFAAGPEHVSEKAMTLLCHILNAHQIWNARINGVPPGTGVWDVHALAELASRDTNNFERSIEILNRNELDNVISYTNTEGATYSNTVRDILFHVINHSTYHRAQIATELKQAGLKLTPTDYILYKR
jgi:uncharacterized damage-inducible protein DinB